MQNLKWIRTSAFLTFFSSFQPKVRSNMKTELLLVMIFFIQNMVLETASKGGKNWALSKQYGAAERTRARLKLELVCVKHWCYGRVVDKEVIQKKFPTVVYAVVFWCMLMYYYTWCVCWVISKKQIQIAHIWAIYVIGLIVVYASVSYRMDLKVSRRFKINNTNYFTVLTLTVTGGYLYMKH